RGRRQRERQQCGHPAAARLPRRGHHSAVGRDRRCRDRRRAPRATAGGRAPSRALAAACRLPAGPPSLAAGGRDGRLPRRAFRGRAVAYRAAPAQGARLMFAPAIAFVDLETTGTVATRDRITEIGIVRVHDGELVEEWSTLVNPGCPIPEEIQALTGITNAMVRGAPAFESLRREVFERLDGHLFVAHNARFDYGFLKNEFRRLEMPFTA